MQAGRRLTRTRGWSGEGGGVCGVWERGGGGVLAEGRWYLGGVGRVIASSSVAVLELAGCGGMTVGFADEGFERVGIHVDHVT